MKRLRKLITAFMGVALLAVLAPVSPTPAGAVSPLPITCNGAGALTTVTGPETTQWFFEGVATCQGDLEGVYVVPSLLVTGTSDSIGLCGGDGVVTNLHLDPSGTLVNPVDPLASKTVAEQHWSAEITTFPIATPFLISGSHEGAGNISTRIFGMCPGTGGTPVATIQFTFLT